MTIDEAIIDCKENDLFQYAEWLEELKDYRSKNKLIVRIDVENMDSVKEKIKELSEYAESQYNKGIDDVDMYFKNLIKKGIYNTSPFIVREYLEELKAGDTD